MERNFESKLRKRNQAIIIRCDDAAWIELLDFIRQDSRWYLRLGKGAGARLLRQAEMEAFAKWLKEIGGGFGYKLSSRGWAYVLKGSRLIDKNEQKHKWRLSNGSEILYSSADDPDSIGGMEAGWLWADELARARTNEAWRRGIGRLSQRGAPCQAIVTTTPKGMTWLFDEFIREPTSEHFTVSTRTDDNPPERFKSYAGRMRY